MPTFISGNSKTIIKINQELTELWSNINCPL